MSKALGSILEELNKRGTMRFLDTATEEQVAEFETKNEIKLPKLYREWLLKTDGGECFLPAGVQFFGVAHNPIIDIDDEDVPSDEYIIIGALASGDPIVYKKGEEKVAIYNHEDGRIEEDEIYSDFLAFIEDLANILGIDED